MALSQEEKTSSTPLGYATPEQTKALREYAKALMKPEDKLMTHWTQGLERVVNGLYGGYLLGDTGRRENWSNDFAGNRVKTAIEDPGEPSAGRIPPTAPVGSVRQRSRRAAPTGRNPSSRSFPSTPPTWMIAVG